MSFTLQQIKEGLIGTESNIDVFVRRNNINRLSFTPSTIDFFPTQLNNLRVFDTVSSSYKKILNITDLENYYNKNEIDNLLGIDWNLPQGTSSETAVFNFNTLDINVNSTFIVEAAGSIQFTLDGVEESVGYNGMSNFSIFNNSVRFANQVSTITNLINPTVNDFLLLFYRNYNFFRLGIASAGNTNLYTLEPTLLNTSFGNYIIGSKDSLNRGRDTLILGGNNNIINNSVSSSDILSSYFCSLESNDNFIGSSGILFSTGSTINQTAVNSKILNSFFASISGSSNTSSIYNSFSTSRIFDGNFSTIFGSYSLLSFGGVDSFTIQDSNYSLGIYSSDSRIQKSDYSIILGSAETSIQSNLLNNTVYNYIYSSSYTQILNSSNSLALGLLSSDLSEFSSINNSSFISLLGGKKVTVSNSNNTTLLSRTDVDLSNSSNSISLSLSLSIVNLTDSILLSSVNNKLNNFNLAPYSNSIILYSYNPVGVTNPFVFKAGLRFPVLPNTTDIVEKEFFYSENLDSTLNPGLKLFYDNKVYSHLTNPSISLTVNLTTANSNLYTVTNRTPYLLYVNMDNTTGSINLPVGSQFINQSVKIVKLSDITKILTLTCTSGTLVGNNILSKQYSETLATCIDSNIWISTDVSVSPQGNDNEIQYKSGNNLNASQNLRFENNTLQVSTGTPPVPQQTAAFEVNSTTKGSLPFPSMTFTQRNLILNPAIGLCINQTDGVSGIYRWNGLEWDYLGNADPIFFSKKDFKKNGTWKRQYGNPFQQLSSVYFVDANIGYAVGDAGTILKTTNGGTNWITQISGTGNFLYSVYFVDANIGYAVGDAGTILKTINGGTNWITQTSGTSQQLFSVYFVDANIGYAVGDAGTILKTTNGGTNWITQTSGTSQQLLSVYFVDANIGYVCGANDLILKLFADEIELSVKNGLLTNSATLDITGTINELTLISTVIIQNTNILETALRATVYLESYTKDGASTGTFRFKYGGVTLITLVAQTAALTASEGIIEFFIAATSLTEQRATARIDVSEQGIGTALNQFREKASAGSSANSAVNNLLEITYQSSAAGDSLTRGSSVVELIRV